jgi:membrane associated rhomboid family serine protease
MPSEEPLPAPGLPRPIAETEPLLLRTSPSSPRREFLTFVIALTLVLAFVLIVGIIVLAWVFGATSADDAIKLLTTVSGIMAGLVGAVAGYYFRGREEAARRGEQ